MAPLPNIAMHVEQSPCIRWIAADERCLCRIGPFFLRSVGVISVAVRLRAIAHAAEAVGRIHSRATGILPLGFGWQSHKLATQTLIQSR